MFAIIASVFVTIAVGQQHSCVYQGGPNDVYTLNLTSIFGWRLEYQDTTGGHNYYYTPCINNEVCYQGNAEFYANAVQYKPGANQCYHYLSVDHHDRPEYIFATAAWGFRYSDGELCDQTQQPRSINVYYQCDENFNTGAYVSDVYEYDVCKYAMEVRSPLACVPESEHNARCQWRYRDSRNNTYYLDLSSQRGQYIRGPVSYNGYEIFYSPC